MSKSIKEQMSQLFDKPSVNHGKVTVTYKAKIIKNDDLQKEALLSLEKKAIEARRVSQIEKEIQNLRFQLIQKSDSLEYERKRYMTLEHENAKLRGNNTSSVEKIEKSKALSVTKSKEYKELLMEKTASDLEVKSLKNELTDKEKSHKKLCVEIVRILKKSLQEASLSKAKKELHLRRIKEIEEGNLSVLTEVIAVLSYGED